MQNLHAFYSTRRVSEGEQPAEISWKADNSGKAPPCSAGFGRLDRLRARAEVEGSTEVVIRFEVPAISNS